MHIKSNIVTELLNIMNLRDLPSSLYSVFGRQVLSLSPARDLSVFIDLSLSPWGQITATWNCTFKPLGNYSWGNTAGHSRTQSLSYVFHQELVSSRVLATSWPTPKWSSSYSSNELLQGLFLSIRASVIITQWCSAWQHLPPLKCSGTGHQAGLSSLLCTFSLLIHQKLDLELDRSLKVICSPRT